MIFFVYRTQVRMLEVDSDGITYSLASITPARYLFIPGDSLDGKREWKAFVKKHIFDILSRGFCYGQCLLVLKRVGALSDLSR